MERYAVVRDKDVPAWLRRTAWQLCDDLAELLQLPVVVEFVRKTPSAGDYVSTVPLRGGADPTRSVIALRADLSWDAAQLEDTICHEFGHLAIARLGYRQSEQHADLLGGYLQRELWRFRLAKLRRRRARLLAARARAHARATQAWARNFPMIEFRRNTEV